jgi:hypothetical protein
MELTTLGFIVYSLGIYFFWVHKPMDVGSPIILRSDITLREILISTGDRAKDPYSSTPLDFVDRELSLWTLYWIYWINILGKFNVVFTSKPRPIRKIRDHNFCPFLRSLAAYFSSLKYPSPPSMFAAGICHFPIRTECLL